MTAPDSSTNEPDTAPAMASCEPVELILNAAEAAAESPDFAFIPDLADDDIAQAIESVPASVRLQLWEALAPARYWPVLRALQHDTVSNVVNSLSPELIATLIDLAEDDDLLALADCLPQDMVDAILEDVADDRVGDLNEALSYEEDQVGRFMRKDILRLREQASMSRVRKKLQGMAAHPPVAIFVTDKTDATVGYLPYQVVLLAQGSDRAGAVASPVNAFEDTTTFDELLQKLEPSDSTAWYPVARQGRLIGAVSASAILRDARENSVDGAIREAPTAEEDLFTPVASAARIRAFWLTVNLATAFLASAVIGQFEAALQQVVALAVLMPVVASMGGIAGSQTLAIAIRGLALNHLSDANIGLVLAKEARIALVNGIFLGLIIGAVVWFWFESAKLGAIIFAAIMINGLAAAYAGTFIPFLLKKVHVDPAVSGAVILTTVTDVVGFIVFLGLGSLVFLGL